jgi:hypothetical protein
MAGDADLDLMARFTPLVEDESVSNTLKRLLAGVYFLLRSFVYQFQIQGQAGNSEKPIFSKAFPVQQTPSFPLCERGIKGVLSLMCEDAL